MILSHKNQTFDIIAFRIDMFRHLLIYPVLGSFEPSPHLATPELLFCAFEEPSQGALGDSHTFNLLADAMQDQITSSGIITK